MNVLGLLLFQQRVALFYPDWQFLHEKKKTCFDLLRTGRFSFILRGSCVNSNNGFSHSIGSNNGLLRSITIWVWNWLVRLGTLKLLPKVSLWSLSNFWTHFFRQIIFKKDLWRRSRWRIYFLVYDFSSFHPNNFRNTISWECFKKNDSVQSCRIEPQSFRNSKIDVDPIHYVLMSLPCFMHVLRMTRCIQVDRIKILMVFVHKIHKKKEYCLSVASNVDLLVSILNWWWNANWLHIRHDKCTWRKRPE